MVEVILNMKDITDPKTYLHKQKLRALSIDPLKEVSAVILITPSGIKYEVATDVNYEEVVYIIQELIDVTYDSMVNWADEVNMYRRH